MEDSRELDEVTMQYLAETNQEMQKAQRMASEPYAQRMQAALQLFIRREGLPGNWALSHDGKTIVRKDVAEQTQ